MTNDELLDSVESDLQDSRWALRQLVQRLPHHVLPEALEVDVGRLLAKLAILRKEVQPENSASDPTAKNDVSRGAS